MFVLVQLLMQNLRSTVLRTADTCCTASKEHHRIYLYGSRYKAQPIFSLRFKRRPATLSLLEVEPQFMMRFRIEHFCKRSIASGVNWVHPRE